MDALLNLSTLPHEAIPFDKISEQDYIPALKKGIEVGHKLLEEYCKDTTLTFEAVIEKLDEVSEKTDYIANIFYALYSAHATEELRKKSQEFSQLITEFGDSITLNTKVFERVKALYDKKQALKLTAEQDQVLEKYYSDFARNGALLNDADKEKLKTINKELSELSLKFSDNVLQSMNELNHHITDKSELAGIPENVVEMAADKAKSLGKEGWVLTLDFPCLGPVFQFAQNRELRKTMRELTNKKGKLPKFDNEPIVKREVELRLKRAQLLGYPNHASFILEKRMAQTPMHVMSFLNEIYDRAFPAAMRDLAKLKAIAKEDGVTDFAPWDQAYYSEILKKKELNFDDNIIKPYFQLEKVIDGVFIVANKLFGLNFKERSDLPKYHEEVKIYEVSDQSGYVGLFYADFFPRDTKKSGAWMTDLFKQGLFEKKVRNPHVAIVCNFSRPSKDKPSLLGLNEVLTLFHEFGHALHGLLSKCRYRSVSGTSVYWDFVELPSQIMENWVKQKECLDLFAAHFETGAKIPAEIIDKIEESNKFQEGIGTLRQLSFAFLDMGWHSLEKVSNDLDVKQFEINQMKRCELYPKHEQNFMSFSFGHLFAGGYSAGYYSYKWAEVLDADAFEYFKEHGIFNRTISDSFRKNILERGGSEDPAVLYQRFRGQEASVDALLRRAGL